MSGWHPRGADKAYRMGRKNGCIMSGWRLQELLLLLGIPVEFEVFCYLF